jgi:hypothetical protein
VAAQAVDQSLFHIFSKGMNLIHLYLIGSKLHNLELMTKYLLSWLHTSLYSLRDKNFQMSLSTRVKKYPSNFWKLRIF